MLMNLSGFDNVDQSSVVMEKREKRSFMFIGLRLWGGSARWGR